MIGIYIIKNLVNNKIYIGSANDFRKRVNKHKSDLRNNIHHAIKLQRSYNKYGEENFEFTLIEKTSFQELLIREQYWIDLLNPDLNSAKIVGGHNRKITSEETKNKISESKNKFKKEVCQFDLEGNFIIKFDSLSDAMKSVNKSKANHIVDCCNNKRAYAYGYMWSFTNNIILKDKRYIDVKQYDLQGNFIKNWKGYAEIARFYNLKNHVVRNYIYGKYNTKNKILENYLWKIN